MAIVTECRRVALSSTSKSSIKLRIQEHEALDAGYRFHMVVRRNGSYWLVSGAAEGTPLVEGVLISLNLHTPTIIFYKTPSNVLMLAYAYGSKLEHIIEARVETINTKVVKHALAAIAKTGGNIVLIDDVLTVEDIASLNQESKKIKLLTLGLNDLRSSGKNQLKAGFEPSVPTSIFTIIGGIAGFIVFISIALYLAQGEQEKIEAKEEINSYAEVRDSIEKRGSVKGLTWQLYRDLVFARNIDGWVVKQINISKETALISVESSSTGRIDELISIVNKTGRSLVDYNSKKATIVSSYKAVPTLMDAVTPPLDDLKLYISLSENDWAGLPTTSVEYQKVQTKKGYSILPMEWNVNNYLEDDFDVLGTLLHMIPVVFEKATLKINDDGTASGKLFFTVYGCERRNIINNGTVCK